MAETRVASEAEGAKVSSPAPWELVGLPAERLICGTDDEEDDIEDDVEDDWLLGFSVLSDGIISSWVI